MLEVRFNVDNSVQFVLIQQQSYRSNDVFMLTSIAVVLSRECFLVRGETRERRA